MKHRDRVSQPAPGNDWTLCAARPDDNDAIVRLVYADPRGDGVKLLGTAQRAIRFGALVASAWPGASWSAATVVEAHGAVVAVLQDGPSDDEFQTDLTFLRRVIREFGPLTSARALPAGAALQRVRIPPPDDSWMIRELHVDPSWRNRGIGEQLLRHGETRANDHHFATAALTTRTNKPARRLYERLGYRVIKQQNSRLYAHVTGAAGRVLMTKTLQHAERRGDPTRPHTALRR
jgi:ribosomal protein S18 acetylase RimI-like enzyme